MGIQALLDIEANHLPETLELVRFNRRVLYNDSHITTMVMRSNYPKTTPKPSKRSLLYFTQTFASQEPGLCLR
ncbi:uncharacterized protein EAF02_002954 [Botrytis sinoallii]|uniref:uncharacterized protein n=1 Tax=Botrytis sinoallii TaxID=1463999 RepID=UPI0018FF4368|nr:uncharacterized protein EAF02_002954 [Botrytis sinoallii]KAF7888413.1 hypothetical protein EAF02_002954 [Botrytis sinoallii]